MTKGSHAEKLGHMRTRTPGYTHRPVLAVCLAVGATLDAPCSEVGEIFGMVKVQSLVYVQTPKGILVGVYIVSRM